jgi:SnoaL-like domain/Activator of Hsp90 ATPase homolog 1-like protein
MKMTSTQALSIARAYHDAWTRGDFERATALLADELAVEVPINEYPTKESFAAAVAGFGSMARRVELLSELGEGHQAMLLYDMEVEGLGHLRVAEHFTVRDGSIARIRQIHDTEPIRRDYASVVPINAARQEAYEAIATIEGVRGWWTSIASGSTAPGGEIHLGFAGMDEEIVMRVVASEPPRLVRWVCLLHTGAPEWNGSRISFEFAEADETCELRFRHDDAPAEMVAPGWERFLGSLQELAETGSGRPFSPE